MKTNTKTKAFFTTVSLLAACGASASGITWDPTFELVSDADLMVPGTLKYAVNVGNDALTVTTAAGDVVPFEAITIPGTERVIGKLDVFDMASHRYGDGNNVEFARSGDNNLAGTVFESAFPTVGIDPSSINDEFGDPYGSDRYTPTTGNANLDTVLNSNIFTEGKTDPFEAANSGGTKFPTALHAKLRNLNPGTGYYVQIVAGADSGKDIITNPATNGFYGPFIDDPNNPNDDSNLIGHGPLSKLINEVSDGEGNIAYNMARYIDLDKDGVSHVGTVTGTFVADDVEKVIDVVLQGTGGYSQAKKQPTIGAVVLTELLGGDANLDKSVNIDDANTLVGQFGNSGGQSWRSADFTGDGNTNIDDANILVGQFGNSVGTSVQVSSLLSVAAVASSGTAEASVAGDGESILLDANGVALYKIFIGDLSGNETDDTDVLSLDNGLISFNPARGPVDAFGASTKDDRVEGELEEVFGEFFTSNSITTTTDLDIDTSELIDTGVNVDLDSLSNERAVWLLYNTAGSGNNGTLLQVAQGTVPEPSSLALLALGGALLARRRR